MENDELKILKRKRLLVAFWDFQGIIWKKWVPEGESVNWAFYVSVLEELREEIKRERRGNLQNDFCFCMTIRVPIHHHKQWWPRDG